jgi:hypothetical protein
MELAVFLAAAAVAAVLVLRPVEALGEGALAGAEAVNEALAKVRRWDWNWEA